ALAQSKLKDTISQLSQMLQHLEVLENRGMISDVDKEKKQKYRSQKRQKLQQMEKQLKEAGLDMQLVRSTVGHPSLEEAQPGLLEAIVQIVSSNRQADERRLIPRQHNSEEEKQHIKMVLVKLLRSQNLARRSHDDTHF
ncbi:6035_t:CDS:2, partial [Dentiscutata erythropus]